MSKFLYSIFIICSVGLGIVYSLQQSKQREKIDSIYYLDVGIDRCLERVHYEQCMNSTSILDRIDYCSNRARVAATRSNSEIKQDCK